MVGVGVGEDNLGAAVAHTLACAGTLLPILKPFFHHACCKYIHVVVVFEGWLATIERAVAFLMIWIALLVPIFP